MTIREQFESRYPIPSGIHWDQSIGTYRITDISRPRNQGSIISRYEAYVHSWGVWKASREAMVVKMPAKAEPFEQYLNEGQPLFTFQGEGRNAAIDECRSSIEALGLRCEVSP